MPADVAVPVESSTPEAVPNFDPSTFTEAQRDTWINTGAVPTVKAVAEASEEVAEETETVEADSVTADETEVVNAAEATPAKKGTQQPEHKGKGADARKEQLNAEIRDLAAKRKAADQEYADLLAKIDKAKKDVPAESSTAPVKDAKPQKPEKPGKKPEFGDIEGETGEQFEAREAAYEEKREKYVEDLVAYRLAEERHTEAEKRRTDAIAAENKRIEDAWNARVEVAKSKPGRDNFAEVAFSKDLPISPAMDGFILDSEIGPEILWYLGNHLDEGKAIAAMNPYRAVKTLTKLEEKLSEPEGETEEEPVKPAAAAQEPEKKPVVVPPTKAKKPPTELRAVNPAPPDDVKAAIAADDVSRFMALRNAQDVAKHKRG